MLRFSLRLQHIVTLQLPFVSDGVSLGDRLAEWMQQPRAAGFLSDGGAQGRYSYLMTAPDAVCVLDYDDPQDAGAMLRAAGGFVHPEDRRDDLPPFTGGLVGMASFELGLRLENLQRRPFRIEGQTAWPELVLMRFPAVLAFDHQAQSLTAIGRGETRAQAQAALDKLAGAWEETIATPMETHLAEDGLSLETPDHVHEDKVAALVGQIHAGDLFQANLARGWTGRLRQGIAPGHVMQALHRAGAAPFGGFITFNDRAMVSNSPERFIRLDGDDLLQTRPIKGTRPRGGDPAEDGRQAADLMASDKDRAENLMIVDLMRHDLSKVAQVGSVRVPALNVLESYPNVHHLVSTVTARLQPGKTATDVLSATFPPGSISGAPKVAAMKVIRDMEAARGPYCGSLFFIDAGGAMDSSVLIRTLAFEKEGGARWHFRAAAGGGIVADSQPVAERIETETKLSLIRRVLE